jgi:transcriptional regulator with PAS, ATPase and Fis domain
MVSLTEPARQILANYRWPGNIRQLKNITEQISIIESMREIDEETIKKYLPDYQSVKLPALYEKPIDEKTFNTEREILYKVLFDMKNDMNDLKRLVAEIMDKRGTPEYKEDHTSMIDKLYQSTDHAAAVASQTLHINTPESQDIQDTEEIIEESLSLEEKEIELIKKALDKHRGKRKYAAEELGISERTLYRKIKEHNLE